nr:MAG TPA: hypothetical protein [Caudoviricetes sp.]
MRVRPLLQIISALEQCYCQGYLTLVLLPITRHGALVIPCLLS